MGNSCFRRKRNEVKFKRTSWLCLQLVKPQLQRANSLRGHRKRRWTQYRMITGGNIPKQHETNTLCSEVIIGVSYRQSEQDDDPNKWFRNGARNSSKESALVLLGQCNLLDVNWQYQPAVQTGPGDSPKYPGENCLRQNFNVCVHSKATPLWLHTQEEGSTQDS